MVELQQVSKSYHTTVALHPIDWSVPEGRTSMLLGPSGCGKSTLLRLINGLIEPDKGSVQIDGKPLRPHTAVRLRRSMGYVIQDGGLFPHMTARDNVTLMARHLGWAPQRIEQRVAHLSQVTRFPADGLSRFPVQLSGGQQQRVSLMRALMLDPTLLLLDEPLGALDPMIRFDLQNDLRDIFRSLRKTVIMVTHDVAEAVFFADRILLMREGRVVQEGTADELIQSPADAFVTQFINAQRRDVDAAKTGAGS